MPKKQRRGKFEMPQAIKDLRDKPDIRTVADEDWDSFEDFYIKAVNSIRIPIDFTPRDILRVNAEVDRVYGLARFDAAESKKRLEKYKLKLSNAQKQAKLGFKKADGYTADDRDALVTTYLETAPLKGEKEPLYTLIERWQDRKIFMDAVIDNLLKKADKMLTGNGSLKLDARGRGDEGDTDE